MVLKIRNGEGEFFYPAKLAKKAARAIQSKFQVPARCLNSILRNPIVPYLGINGIYLKQRVEKSCAISSRADGPKKEVTD